MTKSQSPLFSILLDQSDRAGALSRQIYNQIKRLIQSGHLKEGDKLPSSRDLCKKLGIGRITVISTYKALCDEGFVESIRGSGTVVSYKLSATSQGNYAFNRKSLNRPIERNTKKAEMAEGVLSTYVPQNPTPFSLYAPDADSLPGSMWTRIVARLSKSPWRHNGYADPAGYYPCREALSNHLRKTRGIVCTPDQIIMTTGVQQGLNLCAQLLFEPGDYVGVEDPSFQPYISSLEFLGLRPRLINARSQLTLENVKNGKGEINGLFVTPTYQYPLGHTINLDERLKIVDWASQKGTWIIEHNNDSDLLFSSNPLPALMALRNDSVVYLGSFSQTIYPGLCLGYLVAPKNLALAFAGAKLLQDRHVSEVHQTILSEFISGGFYEAHIRRLKKMMESRKKTVLRAVESNLRNYGYLLTVPEGSHITFVLDSIFENDVLLTEFLRNKYRIETIALSTCYRNTPTLQGLILGFAHYRSDLLERTFTILQRALKEYVDTQLTNVRVIRRKEKSLGSAS